MCNLHGFLERESNFLIKKPKIADKRPLSASQPTFGCLLPLDQLRLPHQKKNRISISKTPASVLPLPWSLSMTECKWRLNESPFKACFTVAKFAEGQGEKKKKQNCTSKTRKIHCLNWKAWNKSTGVFIIIIYLWDIIHDTEQNLCQCEYFISQMLMIVWHLLFI